MIWRSAAVALLAFLVLAVPAPASADCAALTGNLVADCSFEQPAVPEGGFSSFAPGTVFGNWTVIAGGDSVDLVNRNYAGGYPVADGVQSLDLNSNTAGGAQQTISTTPGTTYRVSFSVSEYPPAAANCAGIAPQTVRVSAGRVRQDFSHTRDPAATNANQPFEQHSVDFTAISSSTLLSFRALTGGCTGPVIDDVSAAQTTPPAPSLGRTMTAAAVSGRVLARLPGTARFVRVTSSEGLPVGTVVDARRGRVRITATSGAASYSADFYQGQFVLAQVAKNGATADIKLFGGSFRGCPGAPRASVNRKRAIRRLWGSGSGPFRTVGRFSSATVRGITWLTEDQCASTLTKVTAGAVRVRDFAKRKFVVVRAGEQYRAG